MKRAPLPQSAAIAVLGSLVLAALAGSAFGQAPAPSQGARAPAGTAPSIQQPVRAPAAPGSAQAPAAQAEAAPQEAAPPPRRRVAGYLGADRLPDDLVFLPPPPAVGSPLGIADVAIFKTTRALENGPRWALATSDNSIDRKSLFGDFSCALGLDLATLEPPAITRLIARSSADLFGVIGKAKDRYQRPRPFVTEEGPVCIVPSEEFARSGSYPSGHSAT
ncbi:MAG TPA: hypothetical protein VFO94_06715, partial [Gammaproteobacteria bacterium]|nr:hypothetical protein [Gammaproteobacteria bacterium]